VTVALIVLAALALFTGGIAVGQAVTARRGRVALDLGIQRDAVAVLRDLALTPDVLDRHALTMTPGAQSVHHRAHDIVTRYDRANRKDS
jgi:hypothetical protein